MPERPLILTGFMGSGKSTVGRMLARRLRFRFLDTDKLVEERAHMRIPEIFEKHGEADFRGSRFGDHSKDLKGDNELLSLTRPDVIRAPAARGRSRSSWFGY